MNKKLRYSLITLGVVVFLILAPAIVLYVKGINFDFATRRLVQTGILAIRSEPKDAQVFLDNKLVSQSAKDLKFILPKEYNLSLKKEGYESWQKRLRVNAGQITYSSPNSGQILLFYSDPKTIATNNGASDFVFNQNNNQVAAVERNSLLITNALNNNKTTTVILPRSADSLVADFSGQQFILQNSSGTATTIYVNVPNATTSDISSLFTGSVKWYFNSSGRVYALTEDGELYAINVSAKTKKLQQDNVKALTFLSNDLYLLKKNATSTALSVTGNPGEAGQDILTNLPGFSRAEIIVTPGRQLFILGDGPFGYAQGRPESDRTGGTLYRVGTKLTPIVSNVASVGFDEDKSALIIFHDGELDFLNPSDNQLQFISRRGSTIQNPLLRQDLGQAFFVENNAVKVIELDTRDHQNEFVLYTGSNIKKIALDGDGKNLVILDGDQVKTIQIR